MEQEMKDLEINSRRKVVDLDVNDVLPNRFQPRIKFNEDSINELSESIKEHGVIQPIVVRPMGDKFEIIAGERRYKATLLAGKQKIPAIITDLNDKDSAEVALIENVQRQDLTPIEEAISYKKILDMGYLTQEELASKLGKNQSTVANKLRLLNLAEEVQEAVLEEKISERHARSLLKLQNQNQQLEMLNKIIENRLTVRKTDEEIAKILKPEPVTIDSSETPNMDFNPFNMEPLKEKSEQLERGKEEMFNTENTIINPEPIVIEESNSLPNLNNIPVTPIEDVTYPSFNNDALNPGFMDVNRIEATATDINVAKPEVDINSLLTPSNIEEIKPSVDMAPIAPVEEKTELKTGKFFNLPFNDEPETDAFDPFAPIESVNKNDIPSVGLPASATEPTPLSNPSSDALFNFNFDEVVSTPVETTVQPEPVPVATPSVDVNPELNMESPISAFSSPIQPSLVPDNQNVFPMQQSTIPSMIETPIVGEELPVPTLEKPANRNTTEAINIIRNCSKELEKIGFVIDVEEIDFESMYQIIIKINK